MVPDRYLCHCCGAESYAALGKAALGPSSTFLVNACVLGNGLIALVPRAGGIFMGAEY